MSIATYPAYSASEKQWRIGASESGTSGTVIGMSGTDQRWMVRTMRLRLNPGTYTLKTLTASVSYASTTNMDVARFVIFGGNTSSASLVTLSNGLTYVDITANQPANDSSVVMSGALGDVTVTLAADTTYWFGIAIRGVAGRTTARPTIKRLTDPQWVLGDHWYGEVAGATMPTDTSGLTYQDTTAGTQCRMTLLFSTAARTIYSISSSAYAGTALELILPRPVKTDIGAYWIKLGTAVVADGEALTFVGEYDNASNEGTRFTGVLDMGATDQVTFGGANVSLAGGAAEAGDNFDLGINLRGATDKADLFYLNRTTGQGAEGAADFCTISHAAKNNAAADGSRGQSYTVTDATHSLKISGTATIARIEVGWEPIILFGDSQTTTAADKLGAHLPTAFTYDRMYWNSSLSGNRLTATVGGSHTAGHLRYKHGTNGLGDLCEMRGVLFCIAGIGVNDISAYVGTTEAARNKTVATMLVRIAETLDDLAENSNTPLIIGLPPYSDGSASTEEALAIKNQYNIGLEGLAIANRCAFLNPWFDIVTSGTQDDAIPAANPTYNDGLHYTAAGSALVASLAAVALESGIVGGPWISRGNRRIGMLVGITLR